MRAAALGPFEHRQLRLAAANQPGIEQLARLDLPRLGAAIVEDDVIFVRRADLRYRHLLADHAQPALDRLRGRSGRAGRAIERSEEHTSELQSLMRISYAVFCLKKKKITYNRPILTTTHSWTTNNLN